MKYQNELQNVAQQILESPKTTVVAASATTSIGIANITDFISGTASVIAILSGLVITFLLGRVHWINARNGEIQGRILRKQAKDQGVDLSDLS